MMLRDHTQRCEWTSRIQLAARINDNCAEVTENLQHKWHSQAVKTNSDEGRLCAFLDFNYIHRESCVGIKPIEHSESRYDCKGKQHYGNRVSVNNVTNFKKAPTCVFCKGDDWISRCDKFKKKPAEERNFFVKDKRLCFNCLSDSHLLRQSKSNLKCRECNKSHHTLLHRQRAENNQKEKLTSSDGEQ